jgi:hypothetical protein
MHSSTLSATDFSLTLDGGPASLADVLPGFDERDRVGIVVRRPCGVVGASTLLLAAVTAFFDGQRAIHGDAEFFIYPDYFTFHVGGPLGAGGWLDIWPEHKEVVVPDGDAEALLRAINDRAITRLLVPDGAARDVAFERQTRASAQGRIVTALAYSAAGRVPNADVTVRGTSVTESFVDRTLQEARDIPVAAREAIGATRPALDDDGAPVESYRRLELDEALRLLG